MGRGITALDVSDNPNVTTVAPFASSLRRPTARRGVGDSGLARATRLEHLDVARNHKITMLVPLSVTLQHIGGYLAGCDRLVRMDLSSPMPALSSIGDEFLHGCSRMTAIDLGGFANVTRIGDNFLGRMGSLTSLDLRPLSRVESVGDGFLVGCDRLEISRVERGESPVWQRMYELIPRR